MALEPRPLIEQRGLALPALRTAGGYFASKGPHDVAWGDLLLAIFTRIGARFMRRNLGSDLAARLFEPQGDENPQLIELIIEDVADRDVPQIILDDVLALIREQALNLRIAFHLVDDETVDERLIELRRDNQIRIIASQRFEG